MSDSSPFSFQSVRERYFSPSQIARIQATTIGIAGAGGLGSNCAVALVRCGFPRFIIADFDVVEFSNLNRQAYFADQLGRPKVQALRDNILRINPDLDVTTHNVRLNAASAASIFQPCTVVVEAFDTAECKAMIAETFCGSDKLVVCASGLAGFGNSDRIVTRKIRDRFYVVGDMTTAVSGTVMPHAPCVSIAAAKQADLVLQWVLTGEC